MDNGGNRMPNRKLDENFSTTLLSMLFALVRDKETRNAVWGLPVTLREGTKLLGDLLPLGVGTEVWMCRDLWTVWPGGHGATADDARLFGNKKPDIWCEDDRNILFVENKVGGGRKRDDQETPYLGFLRKDLFKDKRRAFFYAVPAGRTVNRACEWVEFVSTPDSDILRGLVKWDTALAQLLTRHFNVPLWFAENLPDKIGA